MNPKILQQFNENKSDVLIDNNYDNAPPQAEPSFEYTDSKKKVKMEWKTNKDEQIHKRGAENFYKNKLGPRRAAKFVKNPSYFFSRIKYTSKNMQPVIVKFSDPLDGYTKYSHVKLAGRVDAEAFIGILYLRAAFRLNILDREVIWYHESAHDIIGATMSLHRFKFICCLITFDDNETRNNRWKTDKFTCMRELFEGMNERNARTSHPSPLVAIDETLYSSNTIQLNQLSMANCTDVSAILQYLTPTGKPEKVEDPAAKYYITGTEEYSKYLINELSVYCNLQGINISMDRYFTSVYLTTWALEKNITNVGTMKHD